PGARSGDPRAVWSIYLVNLVFWAGLAVTGPAIAAMMQLTEARWSPSVRRIALTTAGFLPAAFVLFLVLVAGQTTLYPWVTTPVPAKQAWLNVPFFWLRTLTGAAALFGAALALVRALVRDAVPPDDARERARRNRLAVVLLFLWSQYLVIWYGNVPVETRFFLTRFFTQPWLTLAWFVLVVGWLIPFAYLLKRLTGRPPQRHAPLVVVSVFGLVAIFLERVLVVFPTVSTSARLPFGARDLAITAGFLALFVLSRRWFFSQ